MDLMDSNDLKDLLEGIEYEIRATAVQTPNLPSHTKAYYDRGHRVPRAVFDRVASILRTNPPTGTGDYCTLMEDGLRICALGRLAETLGVSCDTLLLSSEKGDTGWVGFEARNAIAYAIQNEFGQELWEYRSVIVNANDTSHGSPEERAEVVLAALELVTAGKDEEVAP